MWCHLDVTTQVVVILHPCEKTNKNQKVGSVRLCNLEQIGYSDLPISNDGLFEAIFNRIDASKIDRSILILDLSRNNLVYTYIGTQWTLINVWCPLCHLFTDLDCKTSDVTCVAEQNKTYRGGSNHLSVPIGTILTLWPPIIRITIFWFFLINV